MTSFFYPLYSRDFSFENIFSSESLSPPRFYSERGFGINYWRTLPRYQSENAIVLYDAPPKFEVEDGTDAVKFILQIHDNALDPNALYSLSSGVFAYVKTIYLSKTNFSILFFTERDRNLTLLRAATSLPTKDLNKYSDNFILISEDKCKQYDSQLIQNINFSLSQTELNFDRKFNSIKGLIYGFVIGQLINIVPKELSLKKVIRELTNRFAEIKNKLESSVHLTPSSRRRELERIAAMANEVMYLITQVEHEFKTVFPLQTVTKKQLAEFIFQEYSHLTSLEGAYQYISNKLLDDELLGKSDYETLLSQYYKKSKAPSPTSFLQLKNELENYIFASETNSRSISKKESSNLAFKDLLHSLDTFLDHQILTRCSNQRLELTAINYDLSNHNIVFLEKISGLDLQELSKLQSLTNILLKNSKSAKGGTHKEILLSLIQKASFSLSDTDQSTDLYKYINNETTSYSLNSISSPVVKNFVSFIFNPDSLEKLMAFNQVKSLEHQWISYIFWCTFNGFANVSKNFLRPIFAVRDSPLQASIDNYLSKLLTAHHSNKPYPETWTTWVSDDNFENKVKNFYKEYIQSLHNIPFDQFQRIAAIQDRTRFVEILKRNHGLPRNEGIQIFNVLQDVLRSQRLFL